MRCIGAAMVLFVLAAPLAAQSFVSVDQLEEYLLSGRAGKEPDAALARQLSAVELTEQLTGARLAKLMSSLRPGPQTAEMLEVLAAASVFKAPPAADAPAQTPPSAQEQRRMLQAAEDYADSFARRLPDFFANRSTRSYDNAVQLRGGKKHGKAELLMHYVGGSEQQVTVRLGHEVPFSQTAGANRQAGGADGMTTWGEFGPLLAAVFDDARAGRMEWNRWQYGDDGERLAVFRYSVPRTASHDLVDVSTSFQLLNSSVPSRPLEFRDSPAYHGDLYVDAESGLVLRVTLDAELGEGAPVLVSRLAVDYAAVEIGGKTYTCPVRGVAVSVVPNSEMESLEGGGPERFVNLVRFNDYHKFTSSSRIVTDR